MPSPLSWSSPRTSPAPWTPTPVARTAYDRLAYSHKSEHVRAIESAKKPETRLRRIEKAMARWTGVMQSPGRLDEGPIPSAGLPLREHR